MSMSDRCSSKPSASSACRWRSARTTALPLPRLEPPAFLHWRFGGSSLALFRNGIDPGKPQQNGRHERMHRTLKAETATPPAATIAEQQARFDAFRRYFNEERPHEALGFKTPAAYYVPSPRPYPCPVREVVYPDTFAVRRVRSNGEIKWRGELIFISQVLVGEPVGLAQTDSGEWQVRFADLELGFIDRKCRRLCRRPPYPTSQACGLVDNAKTRCPQGPQAQQQAIT